MPCSSAAKPYLEMAERHTWKVPLYSTFHSYISTAPWLRPGDDLHLWLAEQSPQQKLRSWQKWYIWYEPSETSSEKTWDENIATLLLPWLFKAAWKVGRWRLPFPLPPIPCCLPKSEKTTWGKKLATKQHENLWEWQQWQCSYYCKSIQVSHI